MAIYSFFPFDVFSFQNIAIFSSLWAWQSIFSWLIKITHRLHFREKYCPFWLCGPFLVKINKKASNYYERKMWFFWFLFYRFRKFVTRSYGKGILTGEKKFLKKTTTMQMKECYFMVRFFSPNPSTILHVRIVFVR